jgi:hypothetical protein
MIEKRRELITAFDRKADANFENRQSINICTNQRMNSHSNGLTWIVEPLPLCHLFRLEELFL